MEAGMSGSTAGLFAPFREGSREWKWKARPRAQERQHSSSLKIPIFPVYVLGGYDHGYDDDYALEVVVACVGTVYMIETDLDSLLFAHLDEAEDECRELDLPTSAIKDCGKAVLLWMRFADIKAKENENGL